MTRSLLLSLAVTVAIVAYCGSKPSATADDSKRDPNGQVATRADMDGGQRAAASGSTPHSRIVAGATHTAAVPPGRVCPGDPRRPQGDGNLADRTDRALRRDSPAQPHRRVLRQPVLEEDGRARRISRATDAVDARRHRRYVAHR